MSQAATQDLKSFRHELTVLIDKVNTTIAEREKQKRNVLLSKADAGRVMGYKDASYIYKLDIPWNGDDMIRYNDLYEWAKDNKSSRLNRMRQNIRRFV